MNNTVKDILKLFAIGLCLIGISFICLFVARVYSQDFPPTTKAPTSSRQTGARAQCNDGMYSYSTHASGTCAGHGGVKITF